MTFEWGPEGSKSWLGKEEEERQLRPKEQHVRPLRDSREAGISEEHEKWARFHRPQAKAKLSLMAQCLGMVVQFREMKENLAWAPEESNSPRTLRFTCILAEAQVISRKISGRPGMMAFISALWNWCRSQGWDCWIHYLSTESVQAGVCRAAGVVKGAGVWGQADPSMTPMPAIPLTSHVALGFSELHLFIL